jgi:hypothetical protein
MPTDMKTGLYRAHASEPDDAYLKSVGLDPASEALAKAQATIAAFAHAVAVLDGLAKRIGALEAEQTRLAKLSGGAK